MTMTDPIHDTDETPEAIRAAAAADVAAADALAAEVQRRALDGDDTVTFGDLETAERQSRWARIRQEAAEKKAAKKAEAIKREAYAAHLAAHLDEALSDPSDDIREVVAEALPPIRRALDLLNAHNRSVLQMVAWAADPTTYSAPADDLRGFLRRDLPAAFEFWYQGERYQTTDVEVVLQALLGPLRTEVRRAWLGGAPAWLSEV